MSIEKHIADQKIHYKNGKNSLCRKCTKYDSDCFNTTKLCEKDDVKHSNMSTVTKCNAYKEKPATSAGKK